jgi:alpha-glucosidase
MPSRRPQDDHPVTHPPDWWRDAVLYQVYVRSFADSDGSGVGDLPGIRAKLPYLRDLGVDGIWLTPFYPSPGADHGYDVSDYRDVDPQFGTLADFDALVADAHALGMRLIVDIVPNHCSIEHPWFREHPDWFVWRSEPNNWRSAFGGSAWTFDEQRGQWYLHLFAPEQPDLDWHNPAVADAFDEILRFWLDRGIDGFRIDVAHALYKDATFADEQPWEGELQFADQRTCINQPEVHALYRRWHAIAGDRVLVGEIVLENQLRVAEFLRPDELQLAFNFALLKEEWDAGRIRATIDRTLDALGAVGATATWVFENHDVTRLPTRIGPEEARAASLLLLGLPGTAFVYQGQELGLEEVDLPDELRQDPVYLRSGGARKGRDGCRVPIPWGGTAPGHGFTSGTPWLPIPDAWEARSVTAQQHDPGSMLEHYRTALSVRRASEALRRGTFRWLESRPGTLSFEREAAGETVVCVVDVDGRGLELPAGELLLASDGGPRAAWVRTSARI